MCDFFSDHTRTVSWHFRDAQNLVGFLGAPTKFRHACPSKGPPQSGFTQTFTQQIGHSVRLDIFAPQYMHAFEAAAACKPRAWRHCSRPCSIIRALHLSHTSSLPPIKGQQRRCTVTPQSTQLDQARSSSSSSSSRPSRQPGHCLLLRGLFCCPCESLGNFVRYRE